MTNLVKSICRWRGGPDRGKPFDDGIHSGVKQFMIRLILYEDVLWPDCIRIEYHDGNGISSWSEKHGRQVPNLADDKIITIGLDYPKEYLTAVCGHAAYRLHKVTFIHSITFKSNKRIYGPFGHEIGDYFSTVTGNMIVGFYGVSDRYGLREIGAHMKPLDSNYQICRPKDLLPTSNSYPICPPKDLLPVGVSLQIKQKKDEDDNTNKYSSFVVTNNQISGNEGDRNGGFVFGNRIKYVVHQYNCSEKHHPL